MDDEGQGLAIASGTGALVNQAPAGLGPDGLRSPIAGRPALDQSLIDLLDKHDLLSVSIVVHRNDTGDFTHVSTNVQWRDDAQEHRRGCSSGNAETISAALPKALAGMIAERAAAVSVSLPDEALLVEA